MMSKLMDLLERAGDARDALRGLTRRELLSRLDRMHAARDYAELRLRSEREKHEQFLEWFLVRTVSNDDLTDLREEAKKDLRRLEGQLRRSEP
jgi:hypothetical protein